MWRKWFTPLLVSVLAGLSYWLFSEQPKDKTHTVSRDNRSADTFMENFTTRILNAEGKPRYEVQAASMVHYPYDDHSEFTAPQFIVHQSDGGRWHITAEQGQAQDGTEQILLQGNVVITQQGKPDLQTTDEEAAAKLELRTSELLIRPDEEYAETQQLATIRRGRGTLQSLGLRAYFGEERMQLLSQVVGRYEPEPQP